MNATLSGNRSSYNIIFLPHMKKYYKNRNNMIVYIKVSRDLLLEVTKNMLSAPSANVDLG